MTKITMESVYSQIREIRETELIEGRKESREVIAYPYSKFSLDCRRNDLITSELTIKNKWIAAVADGVIYPFGGNFKNGWLAIEPIEKKTCPLPSETCVCMCVCEHTKVEGESQ